MDKPSSDQIQEVKTQIRDIKSIMNISGSAFSLIYSADNLRSMLLISGILSVLFPLAYQILLWAFGTQALIPQPLMLVFFGCVIACWGALLTIKTAATLKAAKQMGMDNSMRALVVQLLSTRIWLAIVPVLLVLCMIPVKFAEAFEPLSYVPYFGIILGLLMNMIGVMIREAEYSCCGAWMILSGAAGLFLVAIPTHVAFAVILAPGCFLFVIVNSVKRHAGERSNEAV